MTTDDRLSYVVQGSKHPLDRRIILAKDETEARKIAQGSFGMSVVSVKEI